MYIPAFSFSPIWIVLLVAALFMTSTSLPLMSVILMVTASWLILAILSWNLLLLGLGATRTFNLPASISSISCVINAVAGITPGVHGPKLYPGLSNLISTTDLARQSVSPSLQTATFEFDLMRLFKIVLLSIMG